MRTSMLLIVLVASGCGGTAPAEGSLPCVEDLVDVWRVDAGKGGSLRVVVDTVADASAFDPLVDVYQVTDRVDEASDLVGGTHVASADDEFPCSFAPEGAECPQLVVDVSGEVGVVVGSYGDCSGADAEYLLEAELDGRSVRLRYVGQIDATALPGGGEDPVDDTGDDAGR